MNDFIINNLNYNNVLNDFSITIKKESFVTIVGPNDCGKTTLLRSIENIKNIMTVIPKEIIFETNTLENELLINNIDINKISDKWDKRLLKKQFSKMTEKEIVLSQIVLAVESNKDVVFIDDISSFFSLNERKKIWNIIVKKTKIIVYLSILLDDSLSFQRLYIMDKGKIVMEDEPQNIIIKDNVLNKIGLKLPFMVDLSVKLQDYNLIDSLELDTDRMVDKLWN
ncbi:MAG: ATP-binding cassette domain-containing protein [Bacilli bacterium]|nr:ATP-binding cassette domain-containing protein [Bacilli bacterium]